MTAFAGRTGTGMKLLLTSGGVSNPTIRAALDALLPRPLERCNALIITTASYGHPVAGPERAWEFIAGRPGTPAVDLGWASLGVLELTALPSLPREQWEPWVRETDALLVNGGCAAYLGHWLRESGVADLFPTLHDTVWVGISAGSMVMAPRLGDDFVEWNPPDGSDRGLGVVGFSIFPHLNHPQLPENTLENARNWAADLGNPAYALDDQSAIVVADGEVEIVSEGEWTQLRTD